MPLLDIATAQPSFQNHLVTLSAQTLIHGKVSGKFASGPEKRLASAWKPFQIPKKVDFNVGHLEARWGKFLIKAVATLEAKCSVQGEDGQKGYNNLPLGVDSRPPGNPIQSSSEEYSELDERERLRRMRISKANKGNTPWNKGKKHSAETLQRIRERTKLAMQDPKVKMKLVNLGHAQSEETRVKIGVGVRMGWQRRREKRMLQETCYFEWQSLIAEASRRGYAGEEELQWDSYDILDEQLEREWLESVEERKRMPRPKGSKRAPKSPEQRRKISEAISAKWSDPAYRERVCSALAKYHGIPEGAPRKPRRRPSGDTQSTRSPANKTTSHILDSAGSETKSQNQKTRLKKSNPPMYKDPLANSKLEMIKNIRAQRVAAETKKTEAIERARLLIAEAEKAAKALEVAATRSPLAHASLMETKKLIAEAIQSIESIEAGQISSHENSRDPSFSSAVPVNHVEKEMDAGIEGLNQADQRKVNGTKTLVTSKNDNEDFDFGKFTWQDLLNGDMELLSTSSSGYGLSPLDLDSLIGSTKPLDQLPNLNVEREDNPLPNGSKLKPRKEAAPANSVTTTKKWVRGRLVEVAEED